MSTMNRVKNRHGQYTVEAAFQDVVENTYSGNGGKLEDLEEKVGKLAQLVGALAARLPLADVVEVLNECDYREWGAA